jgi:hypothetical protein
MDVSGKLEKMNIASYTDDKFSKRSKDEEAHDFSVPINPANYSHSLALRYDDEPTPGGRKTPTRFDGIAADFVKFELVFDGTGVVPGADAAGGGEGIKQLNQFRKVLFDCEAEIRSPKYLILRWGTLDYRCRVSSLDFDYTLFEPDGTPLRARANVTFVACGNERQPDRDAKTSSERSHLVR